MLRSFLSVLREWSIAGIGGLLIIGGLYLASAEGPPTEEATIQAAQNLQSGAEPQENALPDVTANRPAETAPPGDTAGAAPQAAETEITLEAETEVPAEQQAISQAPTAPAGADATQQDAGGATVLPASQAEIAGDPAKGEQVFKRCRACHSIEAGKNMVGPSLAGVFGRKAGEVANYNYSPALKNANIVWDAAALDGYLLDPRGFVPGNKMAFPGMKNEAERQDVIAYLASRSAPQGAEQPVAPASQGAVAESAPAQTTSPAPEATPTPPPAPQAAVDLGAQATGPQTAQTAQTTQEPPGATEAPARSSEQPAASYIPDVRYTLRSGIAEGRMVFIGVGGTIDAQVNPVLAAADGQVVQITLLNGEGAEHDIVFPDFNAKSPRIVGRGSSTTLVFRADRTGDFIYICSVAGHQLAGMEGQFVVTPRPAAAVAVEADIAQPPTQVPPPIGGRAPQRVRVDLIAVELEGRLAEGTTFGFWTFNGRVPGPMLRVRVGDTLDVRLKNGNDSALIHSVDFHAATGPGGGAAVTQTDPGQETSFTFKALVPGLYVYHCATPMVAHHIANGMYGLILVEPEGGLPPVDREFYVMQGEVYTEAEFGQHGSQEFSVQKLLNERPEYFVFNGAVGALSKIHTLKANVGETVRIFFGVGGPNYTSSFHVIGEIFDRVYHQADLLSPPAQGIQTVTVPAGGAAVVEFKLDVPGKYILVDHALSRAERGLVGILQVEGPPNPEIFESAIDPAAGH